MLRTMEVLERFVDKVRQNPKFDHIPEEHLRKIAHSLGNFIGYFIGHPEEWRPIRITGLGTFELSVRNIDARKAKRKHQKDSGHISEDEYIDHISYLNRLREIAKIPVRVEKNKPTK